MRMRRTLAYFVFGCIRAFRGDQESCCGSRTAATGRSASLTSRAKSSSRSSSIITVGNRTISPTGLQARSRAWTSRRQADKTCISPSRAMRGRSTAKDFSKMVKARDCSTSSRIRIIRARWSRSGFPVDDEKQFAMAVQDVSVEFAKQMKSEHLSELDTDKLIAFRIFRVDSAIYRAICVRKD